MILNDYLAYTKNSESPESYHVWTFLSMVSTVVGKKAWINCNYFTVYPNLYIILVSLPGVGKKSTAMRIGRAMVEDADVPCKITFDAITREALIGELEAAYYPYELSETKKYGSAPLTAIASELVVLLNSGPPMVEFLTDIYDSPKSWSYKTKNCGENIIHNPCLNLISGVTTERFCSKIIRDAVAGGFISRSVIIYDNEIRVISPFDKPSDEANKSRQKVVDRFVAIKDMYGEVKLSPKAKELFELWYATEMGALTRKTANLEFHSRKHIHVLKSAMLLALSECKMVIDVIELEAAIELLRRVEHNMKFIYMSAGSNKYGELYIRILSSLNCVEFVDYDELLRHFMSDVDQEEFLKQISMLQKVKYIEVRKDGDGNHVVNITEKGKSIFQTYA